MVKQLTIGCRYCENTGWIDDEGEDERGRPVRERVRCGSCLGSGVLNRNRALEVVAWKAARLVMTIDDARKGFGAITALATLDLRNSIEDLDKLLE